MKIAIIFFVTLLYFSQQKNLDPSKIILAINSGSNEETPSTQGFTYSSDKGYSYSRNVDYQTNEEYKNLNILYTYDQSVYKTERHFDNTFGYELELIEEGTYVLILKFCEMYFKFPNERKFNILLGNTEVVKDLDIVKEVGPQAAYDEYIEFEFKNNQIIHKKKGICQDAYKSNQQKLILQIEKGANDLPLINGIVLFKGNLQETDYSDLESLRIQWKASLEESKRIELEERKRKYDSKNRLLKNVKDEEFKIDQEERRISGLIRILTSQYGAIIFGTLIFICLLIRLFGKDLKIKQFIFLIINLFFCYRN